jgi:hypothetical protein
MKTLDELPILLDEMISSQKEERSKTFVAKYKGENLIMRSGKSSWKAVGDVKLAVLNHFYYEEMNYKYHPTEKYIGVDGREHQSYDYSQAEKREKDFRAKLWELVEIVELKD